MNVKDILNKFHDFDILAGEGGLDKPVSTVSVMDAPDISNWMKGGEFLITTGFCMKDNILELKDLIIKLDKAKAAALGIKLGRFINSLPVESIHTANELNFPVIYIPTRYAFTDIINPVLTNIINDQTKKLLLSEMIHNTFFEIIIEEKGIQYIVETLSKMLEKDVAFIDVYFNKTYLHSSNLKFNDDIYNKEVSTLKLKYNSYTVRSTSNVYGYIFIDSKSLDDNNNDLKNIILDHASTVLILDMQRRISNHQIEKRFRNEFIYDLITNNITSHSEVENRALLYGWELNHGLICLIIDIDDFKEKYISLNHKSLNIKNELERQKDKIFNISRTIIREEYYKCYFTTFSDSIVFLIEYEQFKDSSLNIIKDLSDKIREKIKSDTSFTVTVGIGSYQDNIMNIFKSFDEAQKAIKIGRKLYEKNITVVFSELGANKILYDLTLNNEVISLCNEYLGPLIEYDSANSTELLHTLNVIIQNGWNLKAASEKLFIHHNTVKYRLSRICDLLNLDLKDQEKKFTIELIFKLIIMSE